MGLRTTPRKPAPERLLCVRLSDEDAESVALQLAATAETGVQLDLTTRFDQAVQSARKPRNVNL